MRINFSLLIELSKRDFLEKYVGSALGIWWAFIWPAVNIFIYTVIFSKVMSAKIPGIPSSYSYGLYLTAGILPWMLILNIISRSSGVFLEKKHIITKVPIQLPILPLAIVLSESFVFFIGFFIFLVVLLILGIVPSKEIFLIPITFMFLVVFSYGLGLFLATLNVFLRDIQQFVGIILQIWFWFTPIVYVKDILPEVIKNLLIFNPAYVFISVFQNVFVVKQPVNISLLFIYFFISTTLLIFSYVFYKKLSKEIRDFL